MISPNGGFPDGAVDAFDLAVSPRVVGLGETMPDAMLPTRMTQSPTPAAAGVSKHRSRPGCSNTRDYSPPLPSGNSTYKDERQSKSNAINECRLTPAGVNTLAEAHGHVFAGFIPLFPRFFPRNVKSAIGQSPIASLPLPMRRFARRKHPIWLSPVVNLPFLSRSLAISMSSTCYYQVINLLLSSR
jgi:hypothetical protein